MQITFPKTRPTKIALQAAAFFVGTSLGTIGISQMSYASPTDPCVILRVQGGGYATDPTCGANSAGSVVAGNGAAVWAPESVAIGDLAQTRLAPSMLDGGRGQTAIGAGAATAGTRSTALGFQAGGVGATLLTADNSTTIGAFTVGFSDGGTALGASARVASNSAEGTALGRSAAARVAGGVALGARSSASRGAITNVVDPITGTNVSTSTGAVSVGNDGAFGETVFTRQITNVENGTADTDAVNVRQVKSLQQTIQNQLGNFVAYDDASKTSVTMGGVGAAAQVKVTNVAAGSATTDAVNFGQLTATNNQVSQNTTNIANNTTNINSLFADALLLDPTKKFYDSKSKKIQNVADGDITATSKDAVNGSQLKTTNDQVAQNTTNITTNATNISNQTIRIDTLFQDALLLDPTKSFYDSKSKKIQNVANGDVTATSKDAVNGSQLKTLQDQITAGVTGNFVAYDDASKTSVTMGGVGAAAPVKVTNVAAGLVTTDAVNFGQLTATNNQVSQNTTNIANNTTNINTLFADALLLDPTKKFYDAKNLTIQNLAPGVNGTDAVNVNQLKAVEAKIGSGTTLDAVLYDDASHGTVTLVGAGGSKTTPVKVANVAAGSAATDAVNFGQLTATNNQVSQNTTNIANNTTAITNNTTSINTLFADALLLDPTKTFYDAKSKKIQNVANGDVTATSKDAVNGSQLKTLQDQITAGVTGNFVAYDDVAKTSVTLGGAGAASPVVLTNVKAGVNTTDAVNFGQLTATNNQVSQNTTNIANNTTNITTLFADALLLDPTRTFYDAKSLKIRNVADGTIAAGSKDAVNGGQLKAIDDKITAVSGGNFVSYDDAGKTSVTLGAVGAAPVAVNNVKEAILDATSKQAVNGSQLFETNNRVTQNTTDINTLFQTALQFNVAGKYYDARGQNIRNVATPIQGSDAVNKDYVDNKITNINASLDNVVKYDSANKDTVTLGGANGTKITNVADGNIAAGSKDAINGGQLKTYGDTILNSSKSYTDNKFNQISQGTTGLFQVNVGTVVNPDTSGSNSVAGGSGAVSSGANSVAIGNNSVASGQDSVALGTGAKSSGKSSVALGNGSDDGGRANVVAVGDRIISNMADGVQNSDGATVGQLRAATAEANNYTDQRVNALHGDIDKLEKRSNAGIASAIALQAPASYAPGATTVRVGTGYYGKQVAIGVSFRSTAENGRWSITGGVSGGRQGGVAAGAGVEWVLK